MEERPQTPGQAQMVFVQREILGCGVEHTGLVVWCVHLPRAPKWIEPVWLTGWRELIEPMIPPQPGLMQSQRFEEPAIDSRGHRTL